MEKQTTTIFEQARPQLLGLAYRLLGSMAEAEDVVQDVSLKWLVIEIDVLRNPHAWLTTCCTNLCLDVLKSARKSRTQYVGPWLPEPLHTRTENTPEDDVVLSSSLTTAFLFLLERLSPKERAAYLLHEIFGFPYEEIATTLHMQPAACRKLVSRAKKFVGQERARYAPARDVQDKLLIAFQNALKTGSAQTLARLLSEEVELRADSGGKVIAVRDVLFGASIVTDFICSVLGPAWNDLKLEVCEINGTLGLKVKEGVTIFASVSFGYDKDGSLEDIFIMRNPDKLLRLETPSLHDGANGALSLAAQVH